MQIYTAITFPAWAATCAARDSLSLDGAVRAVASLTGRAHLELATQQIDAPKAAGPRWRVTAGDRLVGVIAARSLV